MAGTGPEVSEIKQGKYIEGLLTHLNKDVPLAPSEPRGWDTLIYMWVSGPRDNKPIWFSFISFLALSLRLHIRQALSTETGCSLSCNRSVSASIDKPATTYLLKVNSRILTGLLLSYFKWRCGWAAPACHVPECKETLWQPCVCHLLNGALRGIWQKENWVIGK